MDPKYQTLPFNTKFGSKQHKIANHSTEVNNSNNKSEFNSVNVNGMLQYNSNNNSASVSGSLSTNGVSKILATKNPLLEERPSPSGSSCSSEHASLINHNNQIGNLNCSQQIVNRASPLKPSNANVNTNNSVQQQQQYYQHQHKINKFSNQAQNQHQQHQHQNQQQQSVQKSVPYKSECNNHKFSENKTNLVNVSPVKPLFNSQKCQQIKSQEFSVPTTGSSSSQSQQSQQSSSSSLNVSSITTSTIATSNNNNNKSHLPLPKPKPSLPPKPSVPVKPVPPPRQTPSIDSVDNAISILKTNTNIQHSIGSVNNQISELGSCTGSMIQQQQQQQFQQPTVSSER